MTLKHGNLRYSQYFSNELISGNIKQAKVVILSQVHIQSTCGVAVNRWRPMTLNVFD